MKAKRVAIFGLGISGRAALRYAFKEGAHLSVVDESPRSQWKVGDGSLLQGAQCFSAEGEELIGGHLATQDLILLSPGISRRHPFLLKALERGVPIWNEVELAYPYFGKPIIAVTGTNGKTTTATMLAKALELGGLRVFLGGNLGRPFLDYFLEGKEEVDVAVLELSSFQLESLFDFRADVALILNLEKSHQERYPSVSEYALAKSRIARNMTPGGTLLLGEGRELDSFSWPKDISVIRLPTPLKVDEILCKALPMDHFQLLGAHNRNNLWFVYKALKAFLGESRGVSQLVKNFRGLPHRLERLDCPPLKPKLKIFNDAKSTNWQATLCAVKSLATLKERGKICLICGGQKRGQDDRPSLEQIRALRELTHQILFMGECAQEMAKLFSGAIIFRGLEEVWDFIHKEWDEGTILLSPAFPSFDQYLNYRQRGEHFKSLVRTLFEEG